MPLKDHLNKLDYFCYIVQAQSILKASYQLGVTQPQLSRVVRQLEEDLGKKLLVRNHNGVEPTKEGIELYHTAAKLIQEINNVEKYIKQGSEDLKGKIKIGTYDSIARYFFPSFLKFLKTTSPKLVVELVTSRSSEVYTAVKNGQIDIGVCVENNHMTAKQVIKQEIYTDSFGFYHHPAIAIDFMECLIFFPKSIHIEKEEEEDKFLKSQKFKYKIVSDNLETVKAMAEEAVGVGLLPHRVAREAVLQGKLVALKNNLNQNLFSHKIILCRKPEIEQGQLNTIIDELSRFLFSWSKN
ncbi:MAG: LysR family transcriptional regulator [Bdellovibrionales bacterium]|nr:LysR family transcriptional regulator [Bdellovibrionales bacterium]